MKKDSGVDEAKSLICEMCRNFYSQGWVSGTGGGMSIKAISYLPAQKLEARLPTVQNVARLCVT